MKSLKLAFKFLFAGGILYYLYQSGSLDVEKMALYWEKPWMAVFFLLFFLLFFIPLQTLRLIVIGKFLGMGFRFLPTYRITWIGILFNVTLPGAVTGDLIKGAYLKKNSPELGKRKIFGILFLDRFFGLTALVFIGFSAMLFTGKQMLVSDSDLTVYGLIFFSTGLTLALIVFYVVYLSLFPVLARLSRRKGGALKVVEKSISVLEPVLPEPGRKSLCFLAILISVLVQLFIVVFIVLLAFAINGETSSFAYQIFVVPLGLITTAIPVTPAGIGVGHVAFEALFLARNIPNGANVFNLYVVLNVVASLTGILPYLLHGSGTKRRRDDESE